MSTVGRNADSVHGAMASLLNSNSNLATICRLFTILCHLNCVITQRMINVSARGLLQEKQGLKINVVTPKNINNLH